MAINLLNENVTNAEIDEQLAIYTDARRLVMYRSAEERLLSSGQEAWNGDKKLFEARVDYIQKAIEKLELKLAMRRKRNKCGISGCNVQFV